MAQAKSATRKVDRLAVIHMFCIVVAIVVAALLI